MCKYAEIYTQYGLNKMIVNYNEKILGLKIERENIGATWTAEHIKAHNKRIDEEISEWEELIKQLKSAIEVRKENKLI